MVHNYNNNIAFYDKAATWITNSIYDDDNNSWTCDDASYDHSVYMAYYHNCSAGTEQTLL